MTIEADEPLARPALSDVSSKSAWGEWVRTSKPTEWISSFGTLFGIVATITTGILVWRTGIIDTKRSEIAASTALLKLEDKELRAEQKVLKAEQNVLLEQKTALLAEREQLYNQVTLAKLDVSRAQSEVRRFEKTLINLKEEKRHFAQTQAQSISDIEARISIAIKAVDTLAAEDKLAIESFFDSLMELEKNDKRGGLYGKFKEKLNSSRTKIVQEILVNLSQVRTLIESMLSGLKSQK